MKNTIHSIALATLICLGASANAGIIASPASIIDHGIYISDTVNHLDWYKFSNAQTTVGLSFSASNPVGGPGWNYASLAQVRSLQAQFGWDTDTGDFDSGNSGLTAAMAAYLGYTGVQSSHPVSSPFLVTTLYSISAMTFDDDPSCFKSTIDCNKNTTYSAFSTFENKNIPSIKVKGDHVGGDYSYKIPQTPNPFIGTWLTRDSVDAVPCSLSTANTCPANVPEPASIALLGLGLFGLLRTGVKPAAVRQ